MGYGPTWIKAIHRREGRIIWGNVLGDLDIPEEDKLEVFACMPWAHNELVDEGEQYMLEVAFIDQAQTALNYLGLLNDTVVDTDTLATILGEPSGNGYGRQTVPTTTAGFPTSGLQGGDWEITCTTETFTASGGAWSAVTDLFLTNDPTAATLELYATSALSATRTLQDGDSLDTTISLKLA